MIPLCKFSVTFQEISRNLCQIKELGKQIIISYGHVVLTQYLIKMF